MPQVFLGYVKVSGEDYRKTIYRSSIGNPQETESDPADTLVDAEAVNTWLVTLLEDDTKNTVVAIPDGIPAAVKTAISDMFVDVLGDAVEGTKSAIKLSLVDHLHEGYDAAVPSLKAVITSADIKSVAYFPLFEAPEEEEPEEV